jgi:hypothetical protein
MRHGHSAPTVLFTLFASLGAGLALSQEQTGSIEGTARDAHGGVVAGATVTARGAAGLVVEQLTGDDGAYLFPALPPGRYAVTAVREGFAPARVEDIDLRLGFEITADLVLEPAPVRETVTVVSEAPLFSITRSAHTTSLRGEEIQRMPRGRDYTSVVVPVPGVNEEPRLGGTPSTGRALPRAAS